MRKPADPLDILLINIGSNSRERNWIAPVRGGVPCRSEPTIIARCRINECRFGSSSGRRIESITLPVTAFNPKKSKKFVLAGHWFGAQSLTEEALSITCWGKPHQGGISSAL